MTRVRRIVIAGAGLAGLRGAEALRREGFDGAITIVGDEPHEPYDRPPLSKQVALGMIPAERVTLPRSEPLDLEWRLGTRITGLDVRAAEVIAGNERLPFDRLLIATGSRARPWKDAVPGGLSGLLTVRTIEDGTRLHAALERSPSRAIVVGGGFTGCEVASACRALGIAVTLVERGPTPLATALGSVVGAAAAELMRRHGVDLRCGVQVDRIEDDGSGRVAAVILEDGSRLEADVVVIALGSLPNVEWLDGAGLAAGPRGIACDAACRAFDPFGIATDRIFVAGDVARFPHPVFNFEFMTLEHWGNAVEMAATAAHNMLVEPDRLRPHVYVPSFWSSQFDVSIKSVGVPAAADRVAVTMGSIDSGSFVASYGREGRLVAMVGFDRAKWLANAGDLIARGERFPRISGFDAPPEAEATDPGFARPPSGLSSYITLSGHRPDGMEPVRHAATGLEPAAAA